jgi:hypothetical protein
MTVSVREEPGIRQPGRRRQLGLDGIAHPHGRVRIARPDREILRHAFDEPERKPHDRGYAGESDPAAFTGNIELERVHQLMAEDVVGFRQRAAEWEDHASLQDLGHTARGFAEVALKRIGLSKVGGARVHDERLARAEVVVQQARQTGIPPLRHEYQVLDGDILFRVVVDVEVLGLQDLEVEALILDLVLPEVLRMSRVADAAKQHHDHRCADEYSETPHVRSRPSGLENACLYDNPKSGFVPPEGPSGAVEPPIA